MSSSYLEQLRTLQRVREHAAGVKLRLPQMAVVGDQSSGKSSVLTALTGVAFPVNAGICTKAPIVLACGRDENLIENTYALFNPSKTCYEDCSLAELAEKITNVQNKALVECGKKISEEEILVRVCGPTQMDVVVVDLPGIINTGDGIQETRRLIEKYISQPETLVLLVSEAKQDDELVTAQEIARKYDALGERTKRILTKFDNFDSTESQERAVAMINGCMENHNSSSNENRVSSEGELSSKTSPIVDRLAPHALITAPGGKAHNYTPEGEIAELEQRGIANMERAGVEALKQLLPDIYAELICTNLPALRNSIEKEIEAGKRELRRIGEEPTDGSLMIKTCQEAFLARIPKLEEDLSQSILNFQLDIHGTGSKLTRGWSDEKLKPNVFECPLFHGGSALRACMADVTSWWRPILEKLRFAVEKILEATVGSTIDNLDDSACFIPPHLHEALVKCWQNKLHKIIQVFECNGKEILDREVDFGTMDHYFMSKYAGYCIMPEDFIEEFLHSFVPDRDFCSNAQTYYKRSKKSEVEYDYTAVVPAPLCHANETIRDILRKRLLDQKNLYEEKYNSKTLHEQNQIRLFDAIKALWSVEHKTTVDLVLKELRSTLLMGHKVWIQGDLWTNPEIKANAVENAEDGQRRKCLKEKLAKMKRCEEELKDLAI